MLQIAHCFVIATILLRMIIIYLFAGCEIECCMEIYDGEWKNVSYVV